MARVPRAAVVRAALGLAVLTVPPSVRLAACVMAAFAVVRVGAVAIAPASVAAMVVGVALAVPAVPPVRSALVVGPGVGFPGVVPVVAVCAAVMVCVVALVVVMALARAAMLVPLGSLVTTAMLAVAVARSLIGPRGVCAERPHGGEGQGKDGVPGMSHPYSPLVLI